MDVKKDFKDSKDAKDKITLPDNLQREMIKFFLRTSMPKIAADKERQQTPSENDARVLKDD